MRGSGPVLAAAMLAALAMPAGPAAARQEPASDAAQARPVALQTATADDPVRFRIQDQRDEREIGERTVLFVNGQRIGTFVLDSQTPSATLEIVVPPSGRYDYALCGLITVRNPQGLAETHQVNSAGTLTDVDGRVFEALGADDFTEFYLVDRTSGRIPAPPRPEDSGLCSPATS